VEERNKMGSMKPEIIRYKHIKNIVHCKENLKLMGKKLFGDKWFGFIKETTFVHSDGFITIKIEPIFDSPAQEFRKSIEKAGLVGHRDFKMDNLDCPQERCFVLTMRHESSVLCDFIKELKYGADKNTEMKL
jgi:hypothetical protein